jgi:hypothetical protein
MHLYVLLVPASLCAWYTSFLPSQIPNSNLVTYAYLLNNKSCVSASTGYSAVRTLEHMRNLQQLQNATLIVTHRVMMALETAAFYEHRETS